MRPLELPLDVGELLELLDAGELPTPGELPAFRRDLSQWFTPGPAVRVLLDLAGELAGATVLEPSAGDGAIVMPAILAGATVRAHEIDPGWADVLEHRARLIPSSSSSKIIRGDYLEAPPAARTADVAIMNSPYEGGLDVRFLRKAMAEARIVVALMRSVFLSLVSAAELLEADGWALSALRYFRGRPAFRGDVSAKGKRGGPRSDFVAFRLERDELGALEGTSVRWVDPR